MKIDLIVAEIGSTTTAVNAFDRLSTAEPQFLGQGTHYTTVEAGDVRVGLRGALEKLKQKLGVRELKANEMLASSSAAGGLRVTVHGLVYDMTVKAANEAALGAGAIVKMVTAGNLTDTDLDRIRKTNPNIILLAGGVDYGERDTVLFNARRLAGLNLAVPVVYAGNIACQDEIKTILGHYVMVVNNVYPRIDQLDVEPTRKVIQEVFERHIVNAPGMTHVNEMVSGGIMPTPGAVMAASRLMNESIGDLMVLDVGGATTDVHSVTDGSEDIERILIAPEPRAKRTVEGDLGVFVNARHLVERIGEDKLGNEMGFPVLPVLAQLHKIPATEEEYRLVLRLTQEAATAALSRHAGQTRHLYGLGSRVAIAEGKDLTQVKWVIGTGGALTRLSGGRNILRELLKAGSPGALYPPQEASILLDHHYIMASVGVMSHRYPEAAERLLAASLQIVPAQIESVPTKVLPDRTGGRTN